VRILLASGGWNSCRPRDAQNRRDWEQKEASAYAQNRNEYNRAFSACLEGRGYTVK